MAGKVYLGADHGGFGLKEKIKAHLKGKAEVVDFGTDSEESCDYPDFGRKVAESVVKGKGSLGILVCGTGIGVSMAANKVRGARAALCHNEFTAKMAREHNDANVLCLGGRVLDEKEALKIVDVFLETDFSSDERHARRVEKIMEIEE